MSEEEFLVFPELADGVRLVMGQPFLDRTQTLDHHRDRLQERSKQLGLVLGVMQLSLPKGRLPCYIDS
jgi:hypothetical protein